MTMPDTGAVEVAPSRLLIVDDEVRQMTALCNTLRQKGYLTTGFSSAREALSALGRERYDLMLTDLMMPEMDGITLVRAAAELDGELVSVVMTGHGTIDTAVEAMKSGAADYILKPFKLSIVLPVLSRALMLKRLRQENTMLQRSIAERTTQLEAANQELEAFSYSVAHDLRAPVRSLTAFSRIVLDDHADSVAPELGRYLQLISQGAERMGQLIDGLLQLSRLGRRALSRSRVAVAELAAEVVAEQQKERPGAEVSIGELPETEADPVLIRQVLVNLVSNAFKFSRQRQPALITIGCRQMDGEAVYFIQDNGAGFDRRYATKLFGAFQRMHAVTEFEGTGVGLSIVERIIRRHGGRIWAEAAVDQGATFYFTIPTAAN